jgi:SH3 domain-containing YSC84-like protein 1
MKFQPFLMIPVMAVPLSTMSVAVAKDAPADDIRSATKTFEYVIKDADKRIPPWVLQKSAGVVIGRVTQGGFFVGGKGGGGVMVIKTSSGEWSNPAFVNFAGGSIGLQFGASSADIVAVFMDKASLAKVLTEDFSLGGDVKGVGGPVGAAPVTSADSAGKVYTYARRKGLFAGVALEGAKLSFDQKKSAKFYNQPSVTAVQIFSGQAVPGSLDVVTTLKSSLIRAQQ